MGLNKDCMAVTLAFSSHEQHNLKMSPQLDAFIDSPLYQFIRTREAEKGGPCSFTGMDAHKGRWYIRDEDYSTFLDLLHDYLFVKGRRPMNFVEQRRLDGFAPLLIDLDFKYAPEGKIERRFAIDNIKMFTRYYVNILNEFFNLDNKESVRFFVSLRPNAYQDKKKNDTKIKDGIHIQCPDIVFPSEYQAIVREKILQIQAVAECFSGTDYTNLDNDVFDPSMVRPKPNGWFFYGESKPEITAYKLTTVYTYYPQTGQFEEGDVEDYTSRQLMEILSIRYKLTASNLQIREEKEEEWSNLRNEVRRVMNYGGGHGGLDRPSPQLGGNAGKNIGDIPSMNLDDAPGSLKTLAQIFKQFPENYMSEYSDSDKELAKRIALECLSVERADSFQTWIEVGWCLREIDESPRMFHVWMEFSKKSSKFSDNNLHSLQRDWERGWGRAQDERRKLQMGSLRMWARQDNHDKYEEIINENNVEYIIGNVDATHTHIARLMKRLYEGQYCCSIDSKKSDWYGFKNNAWCRIPQGLEVRNKLTMDVADLIIDAKVRVKKKMNAAESEEERALIEHREFKRLHKIETSLYTAGFKDSVMKDCIGEFCEEEFSQKLNSNQFLLGCANGVLDLHAQRIGANGQPEYYVEFREGRPDDYISFMLGRWLTKQCDPVEYHPYRHDDPEQAEIDDFMAKIFPDAELREFMWKRLASCLEGTNAEQLYETWIGVGGNGKSKLVDLMCMVLGDYASSLQSTAMTRKRPESGAANPDIMAIRNKHFIFMAEPDNNEPLNTSRIKQFTGEDVVEARGLFEDQTKFQITGKIFMLCNNFPPIQTMDRGTTRRMIAVPFESKFVDPNSDEMKVDSGKKIFPRDPFLDIKLKKWRGAFLARLVHIYDNVYLRKGLHPIPLKVRKETDRYRETFDMFGKFKGARVREETGAEALFKDIWRVYRNWMEQMGGGTGKRMTQPELQKRLDDEYGQPMDVKKTYKRILLFESDEDVEEYDNEKNERLRSISEKNMKNSKDIEEDDDEDEEDE